MLIMDDLDIELGSLEDLENDNDSSDDNSSKGGKKSKLPLVNLMHTGELYSINIQTFIGSFTDILANINVAHAANQYVCICCLIKSKYFHFRCA